MTPWSTEQVAALAPDASSLGAARKLATAGPWSASGCDERAVWGLAQGSGKSPYQVAVDLSGPAYLCSCPSRKIPCKHALGLLLLWAGGGVGVRAPEPFVAQWLASREERAAAAATSAAVRSERESDPAAREARSQRRAASISAGVEDLGRWLEDLVRQGFAAARERPASAWDAQARRLVDAQAAGLAGRVRRIEAEIAGGGTDWPQRALAEAGLLSLAVTGWGRGGALADDLHEDLRALVGWSRPLDAVRALPATEADWAVAGVRVIEEERLRIRRTWLLRIEDLAPALLLDFAPGAGSFAGADHVVGTRVRGGLHRFPGRSGLRATAGELVAAGAWTGPDERASIATALDAWGRALAADPFCERIAVALGAVTPVRADGTWWLREPSGDALALGGAPPWPLIALAGGSPVALTAEYDGRALWPLCAWVEGEPVLLEQAQVAA